MVSASALYPKKMALATINVASNWLKELINLNMFEVPNFRGIKNGK
jgi:hypothetical protein